MVAPAEFSPPELKQEACRWRMRLARRDRSSPFTVSGHRRTVQIVGWVFIWSMGVLTGEIAPLNEMRWRELIFVLYSFSRRQRTWPRAVRTHRAQTTL